MKKSKVNAFVLCPAGYAPNDNDVCTACLIGSYALAGSAECTQCEKGFSAPVASVSQDACFKVEIRPGSYCSAGSAPGADGLCTFCPIGTYALAGSLKCTHCTSGFSSPPNSVSPDACYPKTNKKVKTSSCNAGSAPVSQANGSKLCTFCVVGTYATAGAEVCSQCPVGFSSPVNSVSKDACYANNLRA
jgi:hypothetical protein